MNIKRWLKDKKIAVLYGGWSAEREISLKSGRAVANALRRLKYKVIEIDVNKHIINKLTKLNISVAFIALHGPVGEDGTIQAILEMLGIPYTGSDVLSSALAMNKIYSKKIFEWHKLPTPKWQVIKSSGFRIQTSGLRYPVVVKPATQGSAIGVSIVQNPPELKIAIKKAKEYDSEIILEEYIAGRELTVSILGDKALPVIEIVPTVSKFYDFRAKYEIGGSKHIIPAKLTKKDCLYVQNLAEKAFNVLGCRAVGRVDLMCSNSGKYYLLEINTIPGMTEVSLLPEAAKEVGLNFENLILKILEHSLNNFY